MSETLRARLRQKLCAVSHQVEFKGRARVVRALHRQLRPRKEPTRCRLPNGLIMWLDLADPLQSDIYYGLYETDTLRWMNAITTRGDTVFDLGAHVGCFTLRAAQSVGAAGSVHAFEPIESNACLLEKSLAANAFTHVRLNRVAVSDAPGIVQLHRPPAVSHNASGFASLYPFFSNARIESAPGVALDDYIEANKLDQIDLIKMDVEAAEVCALRGLARTLRRLPLPRILTEVNQARLRDAKYDPLILYTLLDDYGYAPYRIDGNALRRIETPTLEPPMTNVVFFPPNDGLIRGAPRLITLKDVARARGN